MFRKRNNSESTPPAAHEAEHGIRKELNHMALTARGELYSVEQAREEFGVNGSILAVIDLPTEDELVTKKVGIIDFGEDTAQTKPYPFWHPEQGVPLKGLGRVEDRFGLVGMNYQPADMFIGYAPIKEQGITIGRENDEMGNNYRLGLTTADTALSRNHATINIDPSEGMVYIEDQSANGTIVTVAEQVAVINPSANATQQ